MCRAFVYCILAVLLVAVHSSMAFSSNIHERMSRAERLAVFGSTDSIPEYDVFPVSLSGVRRRRDADESINLELAISKVTIKLNLKPTTRYLATKYTPVWSAESYQYAYKKILYKPLPTAMSDIGNFKMYHDVEHGASAIVYEDPGQGSVMEGIFYDYFVIRSLPKRLMGKLLRANGYLLSAAEVVKRSIISDAEEDKHYCVVFKNPNAPKNLKNSLAYQDNLRRHKRARHRGRDPGVPVAVYPKILIVVDYSIMSKLDWTLTQALRFTLAFWNGVDLIYRSLDKPKVYLNIAGIIIAGSNSTTPYIAKVVSPTQLANADNVLRKMGRYFYQENHRFPMNRYDIILAMTAVKLHRRHNGFRRFGWGFTASNGTACTSAREASETQTTRNTGVVRYDGTLYQITTAAEIIASLLGAKENVFNKTVPECPPEGGRIWDNKFCTPRLQKRWSDNSLRDFSRYFSSQQAMCLRNEPLGIKQIGEVLPGRWLTLDGQCQNLGFGKACKEFGTLPICEAQGCEVKGECFRTWEKPLPGSECGANKYCTTYEDCVPN